MRALYYVMYYEAMSDLTRLWVASHKYRRALAPLLLTIIAFIAGFQAGKVTSPYYAAHPIAFEEGRQGGNAGGSVEELAQLQQAGQAETSAEPRVAAAIHTSPPPSPTLGEGTWVASKNSDLFHHIDCPSVSRIKNENKVWFASPEEAQTAGYSPSECAKDKLNI